MKWKRILKRSALVVVVLLFVWFQVAYWSSTNDCQRSVAPGRERMKAIKFCEYGPPDVLKLEEVEKPVPKDDELLIRVRAASLNFIDAGLVRGPSVLRLMSGLRKPKFTGFGRDFAGVVEVVGKDVIEFKPGDEVFGVRWGALAEYVCVRKDRVALKPANITFEQAGAVGLAGLTALQGLRTGRIHAGQKVLINGASGGVGLASVELGKLMGARVIAAASSDEKLEVCKQHGADDVINYTNEDLRERVKTLTGGNGVDVIVDPLGGNYSEPALRSIAWNGRFLVIGFAAGDIPRIPLNLTLLKGCSIVGVFWGSFTEHEPRHNQENLQELLTWLTEGKLKPHISATYPLERAADALNDVLNRKVMGKVVLLTEE